MEIEKCELRNIIRGEIARNFAKLILIIIGGIMLTILTIIYTVSLIAVIWRIKWNLETLQKEIFDKSTIIPCELYPHKKPCIAHILFCVFGEATPTFR